MSTLLRESDIVGQPGTTELQASANTRFIASSAAQSAREEASNDLLVASPLAAVCGGGGVRLLILIRQLDAEWSTGACTTGGSGCIWFARRGASLVRPIRRRVRPIFCNFVIPGLWVLYRGMMVAQVVVQEGVTGFAAFTRSGELIKKVGTEFLDGADRFLRGEHGGGHHAC